MTDELTPETFEPLVGSAFRAAVEDREVELVLAEVSALPASWGSPRAEPFRLEFTGPAEIELPQATYGLRHDTLGDVAIFIVPIGAGSDRRYEAIFN